MAMNFDSEGDESDVIVEINVTPMVDVLLSLLIIFMISQPTPSNEKISLTVPQESVIRQPDDPDATLLVSVDETGRPRIGEKQLPEDYASLVTSLRGNDKAQRDGRIAIAAEEKTKYRDVIRLMTAAREAGIEKVGVASKRL